MRNSIKKIASSYNLSITLGLSLFLGLALVACGLVLSDNLSGNGREPAVVLRDR